MRIACGLALAIGLSVTSAGMATSRRQDPPGAANTSAQAPTPSEVPREKPATEATFTPDKSAPEGAAHSNPDAGSTSKEEPAGPKVTPARPSGNLKRHKRTAPPPPEDGPRKIVVRKGGAREPAEQIAPGMTPAEAVRQRQSVERLLGATDDQLQMLAARTLDEKRQETVGQIRNYMDHARLALKEGDLRRANTLAEKAHLLSDDLVGR